MKDFEIWFSGYAATGEHSGASFEGVYKGENFDDAVEDYVLTKEKTDWPDIRRYYVKEERCGKVVHAIWAYRLFDNEIDARKQFG